MSEDPENEDREVLISINTSPRFRPLRAFYIAALQVCVIWIGVFTESSAMQWSGFMFLILLVFVNAQLLVARDKHLTIAEAKARLAELEAG